MTRYNRKTVDQASSRLAKLLGVPLIIETWSPGDRHGTRYRLHVQGDTPHTLGYRLAAECGARPTTEAIWHMIHAIQVYQRYNPTPDIADATAQLKDIEASA